MTPEEIAAAAAAKEAADKAAAEKAAADKAAADKAAADKIAADKAAADKAAADKAAADKAAADAEAAKKVKPANMSDNEWKLLKETMERKATIEKLQADLEKFKGIDPERVKQLEAEKTAAEEAARKAELQKAETEGNWTRVRELMAAEHQKEKGTLLEQLTGKDKVVAEKDSLINKLTIGHQFASSTYANENLVIPTVAETLFGQHFSFENGEVVAYDKPAGAPERTLIVGSDGKPLAFEDALKKIVEARPDRDKLVRDKLKTGANSTGSTERKAATTASKAGAGAARIAAALLAKKTAGKKK